MRSIMWHAATGLALVLGFLASNAHAQGSTCTGGPPSFGVEGPGLCGTIWPTSLVNVTAKCDQGAYMTMVAIRSAIWPQYREAMEVVQVVFGCSNGKTYGPFPPSLSPSLLNIQASPNVTSSTGFVTVSADIGCFTNAMGIETTAKSGVNAYICPSGQVLSGVSLSYAADLTMIRGWGFCCSDLPPPSSPPPPPPRPPSPSPKPPPPPSPSPKPPSPSPKPKPPSPAPSPPPPTRPYAPDDLSTWMTDIYNVISSKALSSLWIPGSHDSGTFDLGDDQYFDSCDTVWFDIVNDLQDLNPFGRIDIIKKLAVAQTQNLVQQAFDAGVRYFDFRLYWLNDAPYFVHCMVSNAPFEAYLTDLANAILSKPNSKEVYILHFKSFFADWSPERYQAVVDIAVKLFSGHIATQVTPMSTLSQIVGAGGPKVILLWDSGAPFSSLNGAEYLTDYNGWMDRPYDGKNTIQDLLDRDAGYYNTFKAYNGSRVFVMEGVMTPGTAGDIAPMVSEEVFGQEIKSQLIRWENGLNWALTQYMYANWVGTGKPGMILMLDDVRYTYGLDIIKANLPAPPPPVEWSFGICSASYTFLECDGSDAKRCAPGYSDHNFYNEFQCYCKCCKGDDCGCEGRSQDACA